MHVSVDRTRHHAMPGRKESSRFQSISECDSPYLVINTCGIKHPSQERGGDKVFITGFRDIASEYC